MLLVFNDTFVSHPAHVAFLTAILNYGYNKPRFHYGVITTPRIKQFPGECLLMKPGSGAFLVVLLADELPERPPFAQSTSASNTAAWDVPGTYVPPAEQTIQFATAEPVDHLLPRVLGSIGFKPAGDGVAEITGFTLCQKGVGRYLLTELDAWVANGTVERFGLTSPVRTILLVVIQEHDLVPYYSKFGYTVQSIDTVDVSGTSARLEGGVGATVPFHLAVMSKAV